MNAGRGSRVVGSGPQFVGIDVVATNGRWLIHKSGVNATQPALADDRADLFHNWWSGTSHTALEYHDG
jgi:hypothetical protein